MLNIVSLFIYLCFLVSCNETIDLRRTSNFLTTAPITSSMTLSNYDEDKERIITLSYRDKEDDNATTCSISNLSNLKITTPCKCVSGNCNVGVTGDWNYVGSVGFDFKVKENSLVSNTSSVNFSLEEVPMVSTWETTAPGETITLPLRAGFTYSFTVDWGDGSPVDTITSWNQAETTHTYAAAGIYTVTLTGIAEAWYFNNSGDKDKIKTIPNLGSMGWKNFSNAFHGCSNLTNVSGGNTSGVTSMQYMFSGATVVNPDTRDWDVSNVTAMSFMFTDATLATPDTIKWNTASVTAMVSMFRGATLANPDTSGWDMGNVVSITSMFNGASAADPEISNWDTSSMFAMNYAFYNSNILTPDFSSWNFTDATDMTAMLQGTSTLSTQSYDILLNQIDLTSTQTNVTFHAGNSKYSANGATARANLIGKGWVITDGGIDVTSTPPISSHISAASSDEDDERIITLSYSDNQTDLATSCSISNLANVTVTTPCSCDGAGVCTVGITGEWNYTGSVSFDYNVTAGGETSNTSTVDYTLDEVPMVSSWETTTPSETITLPLRAGYNYNFTADWGDGSPVSIITSYTDVDRIHTYAVAGTYTVTLTGILEAWRFDNAGDKDKIKTITNLGSMGWKSFREAFEGCSNLTIVQGGNTQEVTDMSKMFADAPLANPDTSGYDTSKVTDLLMMFYNAASATPNTSNWDTSLVTNMYYLFANSAANPDVSSWDTSKVVNMSGLFLGASAAMPNTSNWDTSSVTNMRFMFYGASAANPNTSGWDTSLVTNMAMMFRDATSADPDVSGWDTSNVEDMHYLFMQSGALDPDVSGWNTAKVTDMRALFWGLSAADPDVSGWDTSNVTTMNHMFYDCSVANPDVSNFDTSKVTAMAFMFAEASLATPDTSNWDTGEVTDMSLMFAGAHLANPNTSGWDTSKVTTMSEMFKFADAANPNVSNWNTGSVVNMYRLFYSADIANPDMSSWNFANVTDMSQMFTAVTLPTVTYSNLLNRINATSTKLNITLDGGASTEYNAGAAAARANLISDGWTITDGGLEP